MLGAVTVCALCPGYAGCCNCVCSVSRLCWHGAVTVWLCVQAMLGAVTVCALCVQAMLARCRNCVLSVSRLCWVL